MSDAAWKSPQLLKELSSRLADGPERAGFVLADGTIVEHENTHPEPEQGFLAGEDIFDSIDKDIVATWHTHPGATANLSTEDWNCFLMWPDQRHFIVGTDGVREYRIESGVVLNA
jgi:proteasome lid subunit RPN8/RPN11